MWSIGGIGFSAQAEIFWGLRPTRRVTMTVSTRVAMRVSNV